MKNFTAVVGWLLLVAALAVPSFLFYNWLSKSKQQNQAELVHEPMAGSVFPSRKSGQHPDAQQAPPAPSQQAPTAPKPAPASRPAAETGEPVKQLPSASAKAPTAATQTAQRSEISSAAPQGEGQSQAAVSTGARLLSYYNPRTTRDPTFTPDDYRRIKEEERQRKEAERMRLEAGRNKPREPGPGTRINLQGIIGSAVIINGDMYTAGQTVRGVKILKIGIDYIIGEYKGKRFKKVLK